MRFGFYLNPVYLILGLHLENFFKDPQLPKKIIDPGQNFSVNPAEANAPVMGYSFLRSEKH